MESGMFGLLMVATCIKKTIEYFYLEKIRFLSGIETLW